MIATNSYSIAQLELELRWNSLQFLIHCNSCAFSSLALDAVGSVAHFSMFIQGTSRRGHTSDLCPHRRTPGQGIGLDEFRQGLARVKIDPLPCIQRTGIAIPRKDRCAAVSTKTTFGLLWAKFRMIATNNNQLLLA
jgi:hypothetical protein